MTLCPPDPSLLCDSLDTFVDQVVAEHADDHSSAPDAIFPIRYTGGSSSADAMIPSDMEVMSDVEDLSDLADPFDFDPCYGAVFDPYLPPSRCFGVDGMKITTYMRAIFTGDCDLYDLIAAMDESILNEGNLIYEEATICIVKLVTETVTS